ncbi:hypothetical protein LEMLEM_LOCUS21744, partial [Lemmus lemmus]
SYVSYKDAPQPRAEAGSRDYVPLRAQQWVKISGEIESMEWIDRFIGNKTLISKP